MSLGCNPFLRCLGTALSVVLAVASGLALSDQPANQPATAPSTRPADPLDAAAFNDFYNLNYARAVQLFEKVAEKHPNDPFAINHLLTAVLFQELYRMGALNTGEFANDSFVKAPVHNADPKAKERIKELVSRALRLEQKRLEASPNDVDALYARGVTRAQFSTYTALIEHAWFSALRNAVGARRDHERVLELSPGYVDAKLVVGAHNYVLGSLPWGVKVAASLVGLSGSKEKGIQLLQEAAQGTGETAVDAKAVLVLFLRREHRYPEALQVVRELAAAFPHNSLAAVEEGNLLRAAGESAEAAGAYRRVMAQGREGRYPGQHYEIAALNLGDMLRAERDYLGAAHAYEMLDQTPDADPILRQKASLGSGEVYDLLHKRDLALKKYEEVIALNSANESADRARKRIKEACQE
jgi:tetratricopeptide (TPR) repeat protein